MIRENKLLKKKNPKWTRAWGIYIILGMLDKDLTPLASVQEKVELETTMANCTPTSLSQYSLLGFP